MVSNLKKYFTSFNSKDNPSLMEVFKPFYITLSLMGLFPYLIKYPTPDDPRVETKSIILNASCASIMTLALCTLLALNVIYYLHLTRQFVYMIHINYIIEVLILISGGIIAYISTFKNRKVYIKILNEISTTWQDLGLSEVTEIIKYYKFHVKVMIFGWLAILVVWHANTFSMLKSTQSMFIETAYSLLPEIILTSVVGFYYVLILMVACLLKNIDQHVQSLHKERGNEVLNTLGRLELAYVMTIEVKREVIRIFELIIAIILMQGFLAALRQAHGVYFALYHIRQKLYKMIFGTLYILYPVSKLFALSYTGSMLKKMAFKIGQSLHTLPVKEDDTKLFMEIEHFCKLMYHYETDIKIFGFCSLNSNLFFNMIASVVTYFVILVQFDL